MQGTSLPYPPSLALPERRTVLHTGESEDFTAHSSSMLLCKSTQNLKTALNSGSPALCSPTKFAVRGVMECLQMELRDRGLDGIVCTTVCID